MPEERGLVMDGAEHHVERYVRDLTEREAFKAFYDGKGGQRVLAGLQPIWTGSPGHGSPCEEIDYLIGRFPEQASWAKRCGEVKPRAPKTPEEIAGFTADFEACKVEAGYRSAKLTVNPHSSFSWNGNDPEADGCRVRQ
jgi:hypothetical protein